MILLEGDGGENLHSVCETFVLFVYIRMVSCNKQLQRSVNDVRTCNQVSCWPCIWYWPNEVEQGPLIESERVT